MSVQIAKELKAIREHSGLTQKDLSERSGLSQQYVSRIETGHKTTVDTAERYLKTLNQRLTIEPYCKSFLPTKYMESSFLYNRYLELSSRGFAVLSHITALEALGFFSGYFGDTPVYYYSQNNLGVNNTVFNEISDIRDLGFITYNGVRCTDASRTFNDVLDNYESTDDSVILESLKGYYYEHNGSFDGLKISGKNTELFNQLIPEVINY